MSDQAAPTTAVLTPEGHAVVFAATAAQAVAGEVPDPNAAPRGASLTPDPSGEKTPPIHVLDAAAAAVLSTTATRQQRLVTMAESGARRGDSPVPTTTDGAPVAPAAGTPMAAVPRPAVPPGTTTTATAATTPAAGTTTTGTPTGVSAPVPGAVTPGATPAATTAAADSTSATQPVLADGSAVPDARLTTSAAGGSVSAPLSAVGPVSAAPVTASAPFVAPAVISAQLGPRALAAAVAATTDGLHTISVHLRPAQLGSVQVVATMGAAGLSLSLHAATDATRQVLRAAMADLHADLAASGLADVAIQVSDQAPDQSAGQGAGQSDGRSTDPAVRSDAADAHRSIASRVDVAGDPSSALSQPARPSPGSGRRLDLRV